MPVCFTLFNNSEDFFFSEIFFFFLDKLKLFCGFEQKEDLGPTTGSFWLSQENMELAKSSSSFMLC